MQRRFTLDVCQVAVDFHYEVDLSYFLSKWSKIMYFRPENDPFTRLGLRAKTGLFPTFPETPSPSKLKSKLKNSGLPQVPRKYYEEKMSHLVERASKLGPGTRPAAPKHSSTYSERTCEVAISNLHFFPPHSAPPDPHKTARGRAPTAPVPPHVESPREHVV